MRNMKRVVKLVMCALALTACHTKQTLPPSAFMAKMEQQYSRKVKAGKTEYTIQYANADFMACQELDGRPETNTQQFRKRVSELSGNVFFIVKIKTPVSSDANRMVMYYEQEAEKDVQLLQGDSVLRPVLWHFENNYGLSPYNSIVIGFATGKKDESLQLVFNDNYTQTPMIKASYSKSELENLPNISIN